MSANAPSSPTPEPLEPPPVERLSLFRARQSARQPKGFGIRGQSGTARRWSSAPGGSPQKVWSIAPPARSGFWAYGTKARAHPVPHRENPAGCERPESTVPFRLCGRLMLGGLVPRHRPAWSDTPRLERRLRRTGSCRRALGLDRHDCRPTRHLPVSRSSRLRPVTGRRGHYAAAGGEGDCFVAMTLDRGQGAGELPSLKRNRVPRAACAAACRPARRDSRSGRSCSRARRGGQ